MGNYTIVSSSWSNLRGLFRVASQLAMIGLVVWPCWGIIPEGYGGWLTCPPVWYGEASRGRERRVGAGRHWARFITWREGREYVRRSWERVGWQVWLVMMLCGPLRLEEQAGWLVLLPLARWGVSGEWGRVAVVGAKPVLSGATSGATAAVSVAGAAADRDEPVSPGRGASPAVAG